MKQISNKIKMQSIKNKEQQREIGINNFRYKYDDINFEIIKIKMI